MSALDVICCIECGKPWGALLDRGVEPTEELVAQARSEMIRDLRDQWDCDYEPSEMDSLDDAALPVPSVHRVVYISEATARFLDDHGIAEAYLDGCWQRIDDCDVPAWIVKGRKQRWAVLWDCCDIGSLSNYVKS